jgi:uncharacterized delta-60 repeat protein
MAVQVDGGVLVGGNFTRLGGQPRNQLGRLNGDGTLDNSFNSGVDGSVQSLVLQADGKILVGGGFTRLSGQRRYYLGRLNADGTLDSSFNPGASFIVTVFVVQADGRILVGGGFGELAGQPRTNIGRLNADGTLDSTFNPGANSYVNTFAVQADGKILVGGWFNTLGGQTRDYLGRLNADGSLDDSFNPGASGPVSSFIVQADGSILVGGYFTTLGGQPRGGLGRLNANGTLDSTFNPGWGNHVYSLAAQADGKILVGGFPAAPGGQPRGCLGRLNADGTLDSAFNPGASSVVNSLAVQADGKILVGGSFTSLGGQPRSYLGRLNATEPATQSLSHSGTTITWLRGGTSPEVWRTTFECSTNGTSWVSLGAGTRIAGGWRMTGVPLPASSVLRARGYASGGYGNGSGWFVESYSPPVWVSPPPSLTRDAGGSATFNVTTVGTAPLSYHWFKAGVPLVNGGKVAGATTASLSLTNLLGADGGSYWVVVSNTFGSVTSAVATLTVRDPVITAQPVSQARNAGEIVTFSVTALGTAPMGYQWWKDGVALSGATAASLMRSNLQGADAGGYRVVVSNSYGSVTSTVAWLTVCVTTVDTTFNSGGNGNALALAMQADGKILAGGYFTTLGGRTRNFLGRLNADGKLDTTFDPGADCFVECLAVQADGKILAGGLFTMLGGQTRNYLGRLNADGALDINFNPGASMYVHALAVQADGKLLVGGYFTMLGGQLRNNLGRLNADGTLDGTFNPGPNYEVYSLALQADGKILVGGYFTTLGGQARNYLGRLNADGTLDAAFNPGANSPVYSLALQADGKILVGGYFTTLGGQARSRLGRLNADGTPDNIFNPGADSYPLSLAVQADGKILVGGYFTTLGGQSRNYLGRLNADGSLDATFNPGANNVVYSLAVQADGKILVGGFFTALGGQSRTNFGRLNATEPATQSLDCDGSTITWLRGGTSPEVWRTTFESSTNDTSWTALGSGVRIPGGWQLTGISLPTNGTIRARGYAAGGYHNGSGWFVETRFSTLVRLLSQPQSRTNDAGTAAEFSVEASGAPPLGYRWFKAGEPMVDGGNVSGATSASLALANVLGADGGDYWVVVTSSSGSVTSAVATLTVRDPLIVVQPVSQARNTGESVTLSGAAIGTEPLAYQWWRHESAVIGARANSLTLTNLQCSDAGSYRLVASNSFGSVTSAVAAITIRDLQIAVHPLSQNRNAGESVTLSVTAVGTEPLGYQWWKDGWELSGATAAALPLSNLQSAHAGSYWAVVSNPCGSVTSYVAVLTVNPASLDLTFNLGANGTVSSLAVQVDGKVLVGGTFTSLGGQTRNKIGRLNPDGTVDNTFNPGANDSVTSLAVQDDGKILVGGAFTTLGGQARTHVGRLNADGTLDNSFNAGTGGTVACLAIQADGKILLGGLFTTGEYGELYSGIIRLHADGSLDSSCSPFRSGELWSAFDCLALQPDGKIVVGGHLVRGFAQPPQFVGRLDSNGLGDFTFQSQPAWRGSVYSLAVQPDGRILVGGRFSWLGQQTGGSSVHLCRLNPDGTLDNTYNPAVGSAFDERSVDSLALQTDGKLLVGGSVGLYRLNADGTRDSTFNPGANYGVASLALQADGKVLVGGSFTTLGGQARTNLGRLNATEPATQSFSYNGSTITWLRGGTSPEVWRTTFDYSTDGTDWYDLGGGMRTWGGWQVSGYGLPTGCFLRARGYTAGWFVEAYIPPVRLFSQPQRRTNDAGSTATFSVVAGGTPPLGYQWFKFGMPLVDGGKVTGATTANLSLADVLRAGAGSFRVVVSNSFGSVTSAIATLTVREPVITTQPASQSRNAGESVTLSVTAAGTSPLGYQWWKNGQALSGASAALLSLTNLQFPDGGSYRAVASNGFGSVTSAVAMLTVRDPIITVQPVSHYRNAGESVTLSVTALGTAPLGYQWRKDEGALSGATAASLTLTNLQAPDTGNYRVVASNLFGSVTSAVAVLTVHLDSTFNPGAGGVDHPSVNCLALQADGKILLGGVFTTLGGQPRYYLGRLGGDGTLDSTFSPGVGGVAYPSVNCLAVQPNGKILVGGSFTSLGGQTRNYLGRLNLDGTVDGIFNPRANGSVYSLAVQADGKILVGGAFSMLKGQSRDSIGRLNANGTVDSMFNPGADGYVTALAVQADGKILIGGQFTTLGGQPRSCIGRLNSNGTLDNTFNPGAGDSNPYVYSLVVQADGRILVSGIFTTLGGGPRNNLGRLNSDGTLDNSFDPGADRAVHSLALQADGSILVGGLFAKLGGQPRNYLGRLNPDGTPDNSFNPGAGDYVTSLAIQADGKVLVGGAFSTLGGQTRNCLARLNATGPATQDLNYDGSTLTWLRGGTSPEVWRTTFESSTNGTSWTSWGGGTRILGGWQMNVGSLPTTGIVRARGYAVSGYLNSSSWFVEAFAPPVWVSQPASQTRNAGESVTFSVAAVGAPPLNYQWWKDSVALNGATSASLTLNNLLETEAGNYWVVVNGPGGSVTSAAATLTVIGVTVDGDFNPRANNSVLSLVVQADGKILACGYFTQLGGQARKYIGRLNADGTLDNTFNPGADSAVSSLVAQPDGKLVVGGYFRVLAGQARDYLGRLNADGTLDSSFNPGASGSVDALAVQADGKLLVSGAFTNLAGQPRNRIGRFHADGTLDSTFNPGANGIVDCMAVQVDGRILVCGQFTTVGGQPRPYLARLNADGTLDNTFTTGADGSVLSLLVQADGKVLMSGYFTTLGGQTRNYLGRLNADGMLDGTFNPGANDYVARLALQADGKLFVCGGFTMLGGQPRTHLARLNADGTLDNTFNPGADDGVLCLALQADGEVLLGGYFTTLGGQPRERIGRLNALAPASQSFSYDGSTFTWQRGGTSPEVWRTTFEFSADGVEWTVLSSGVRISGGWSLGGLPLLPGGQVRARGYTTGGARNGSAWFVESTLAVDPNTSPSILTSDGGFGFHTNGFGFNVAGLIGQVLVVEGSTDLVHWSALATNTLQTTPLYFSDPNSTNSPSRFYRVRLQ